jgi:hypothetical protein
MFSFQETSRAFRRTSRGAIGAIQKPYTMNGLQNALAFITEFVDGGADVVPPPSMVVASDQWPGSAS